MSALFVRTRRSKFVGILSRYWDTFLSTWSILMHGNPATGLYGGIKVAACGELGMGVGEEERGSGEREVLEGFVGRIEGLVDVIVSKFGDAGPGGDTGTEMDKKDPRQTNPTGPWLGSGNEPAAEDGAIFLGTGALSRKSLRDVSHWIEDLYRWGPYAYGVIDNPSSTRRAKKSKQKQPSKKIELSPSAKKKAREVYGLGFRDKAPHQESSPRKESMTTIAPTPMVDGEDTPVDPNSKKRRPSLQRGASSFGSSDSESSKSYRFVQYLKLGYGTHWSLGGTSVKNSDHDSSAAEARTKVVEEHSGKHQTSSEGPLEKSSNPYHDSTGHYLIGLMGDIENDDGENSDVELRESNSHENVDDYNVRLLLRTLTVELEREEDARAEAEISIDLGNTNKKATSSKQTGSEHTGTSNTSFESQDRNKTKKLRVVVYVNRPFIFAFLFELRTDALALTSLYRSLHYQIGPLHKPLLNSTAFRAFKPEVTVTDGSTTPIYDLIWDPKLLTVNSTIPNIPDPFLSQLQPPESLPWSRIEALNTHMQIINTYIASSTDRSELERTCKTSRGWWVVWTRVPDPEPSTTSLLASGQVNIPGLIVEDSTESQKFSRQGPTTSRGTSTFGASMNSGSAHPFLEALSSGYEFILKDKEIFLIRRARDYNAAKLGSRFSGGSLAAGSEASWTSGPGKLAQGIGVDTKRYIEALLNLNR
jgi:hypothetical protein